MSENKKLYFKPSNFTGLTSENIDSFLKNYDRAVIINGWSEGKRTQYIPVFLEGFALTFYDNIMDSGEDIKWADLKNKFRLEFEPSAQTDMLRLMLEKRKQLPDEHMVSYINDAESLCRRIDSNMSQEQMVRNIIKGLNPSIVRYIGIARNENLTELKNNVRKYEMIEFMIEGQTPKNYFDFDTEIVKSILQQINTTKNAKENEINKLREELKNVRIMCNQLMNNDKNKQCHNNIEPNNLHIFNDEQKQNKFNDQQWYTRTPHTYDNRPYNNIPRWNTDLTYYNQSHLPLNSMNNMSQRNYLPYNHSNINTQKKECSICSKTNHSEYKCFFKNKSPLTCQICNKIGHTANNCNLYINKSKNQMQS